jgi:hypothetical protein
VEEEEEEKKKKNKNITSVRKTQHRVVIIVAVKSQQRILCVLLSYVFTANSTKTSSVAPGRFCDEFMSPAT